MVVDAGVMLGTEQIFDVSYWPRLPTIKGVRQNYAIQFKIHCILQGETTIRSIDMDNGEVPLQAFHNRKISNAIQKSESEWTEGGTND